MNKLKRSTLLFSTAFALLPVSAMAQEELINASDIIGTGVSNGLNEIGQVNNVLLDESGKAVEYLFFDVSETTSPTNSDMNFVEISNVAFTPDLGGDIQVVITDTDAQRQPEELEVSRSEAEYRLLSNILEESIRFSDEGVRKISDILIDAESGELAYYTVEMDSDSFFATDLRRIPAGDVEIGGPGNVSSAISLADLSSDDSYRSTPLQ